MLSIDTLRYDCVGFQPDKRELVKYDVLKYLETPMLDSIAEKSLCFTQCISTSTYTTTSHASIFTGLYPQKHGIRAFYEKKLSNNVTTIAEILKANGYRTILHTDSMELFKPLGLNRGFEFELARNDEKIFRLLEELQGENIFLFCHVMDVHEPYLHNTSNFSPGINDDYYNEMLKIYNEYQLVEFYDKKERPAKIWNRLMGGPLSDRPIEILLPLYVRGIKKYDSGRFSNFVTRLTKLRFFENALTAIFSDHGEGKCYLDKKEYFSHGGELFDNVLRIPLMISHPDIQPGINSELVSGVDITPIILAVLGIDGYSDIDGLNILSKKRETAYAEFWAASRSLMATDDGNIKTVDDGQWPEFILKQMAVRTDTRKFVLCNRGRMEGIITKDFFNLSNIEFVKKLYREILGQIVDAEGLHHHINALNTGVRTKEDLLADFLNSEKNNIAPKYSLFNLNEDFEENSPVDAATDAKAKIYFDYIAKLNIQAVETEDVFEDTYKPRSVFFGAADRSIMFSPLEEKVRKSIEIIKRAVDFYGADSVAVAWTGGKDSTTVLHLMKQAFGGNIPCKVINIDTSVKFPEIYEFRDRLHKEWGFDLRIFRNENASHWLKESKDHAECCHQLKTDPLNNAIKSIGAKALITGVRWDEQKARANEEYYSPRENPEHVRIQPILHFREIDIWQFIKEFSVPYCKLYNEGYRSLGCMPCTSLSSGVDERSGRTSHKEEIMSRLRELGYF